MKCANCGHENPAEKSFCSNCGAKLEENRRRKWVTPTAIALAAFLVALVVVLVVTLVPGTSTERLVFRVKGPTSSSLLSETTRIARERLTAGGVRVTNVGLGTDDTIDVSVAKGQADNARRLLTGGVVGYRVVLDSKRVSDIQNNPALKNDPAWHVSTGEALQPDKPITLPFKENGTTVILKLGPTELTGAEIQDAKAEPHPGVGYTITMTMTPAGSRDFAAITEANSTSNSQLSLTTLS
jgi:predicted nucleic acid-binding Zn ribbon protein